MSSHSGEITLDDKYVSTQLAHPVIRFLKGPILLGQCSVKSEETVVDHAKRCGVTIPTNCTSGTCGTCMVSLILGDVPLPDELPPGLDDFLVSEGARLGCIGVPFGDVDIDIRPPI